MLFNVLNNFHKRLKFTMEKEINGQLNFLDIFVLKKTDGHFPTNISYLIHTKKVLFQVDVNYYSSAHCKEIKINIIKNLIRKIITQSDE